MSKDPLEVEITANVEARFLKDGQFTLLLTLPEEIVGLVGRVAVLWGTYEEIMEALLTNLIEMYPLPKPEDKPRTFKKKNKLFRELSQRFASEHYPSEAKAFIDICDTAKALAWKRNITVHGHIVLFSKDETGPNGEPVTYYEAHGEQEGQRRSLILSNDILAELCADIAHLGGNLLALISRIGGLSNAPYHVIEDRDLIQAAPKGTLPLLPIHAKA